MPTDIFSVTGTPVAGDVQNLGVIRISTGGINPAQTGLRNTDALVTNPLIAQTGTYDTRFDDPRYYTGDDPA